MLNSQPYLEGIQPGGGLIQEHDAWVGDHLHANVDALAFAAGHAPHGGAADQGILSFAQA